MAKDLFADNEANEGEEDNDEDLVPTPPPKPLSKKPRSLEEISTTEIDTSPKKQDLLLNSNLLKSNSTLIKSPIMVDVMSNKCDRYVTPSIFAFCTFTSFQITTYHAEKCLIWQYNLLKIYMLAFS